ncbi:MAG: LysR family transcriptional regulator [Aquincola tertiaricarbonis]|uniref:LysR family transcriptional regulator n=1 Tax=Aquincola tertiaricarbonis TaxID=391953 RepID=UPI001E463344|nr:LysR family transcriptional regulator [Aquincola tertiaricarbonis]
MSATMIPADILSPSLHADDLLLFARVMEGGSFSRAADRLRLPKSTVSRRIAALERRLGERLLQRTTRKLVITEFGQGVLDHARAIAEEVDGTLALALHRQAMPSGTLRVSMPADFANVVIADMLGQFIQRHREITLQLDLSPRRVDLIGESFDLAIRMGLAPDDSQLAARQLADFSTGLYAAPAYLHAHGEPQTPEVLQSLDALMLLTRSGEPLPWELRRTAPDGTEQHWTGVPPRRTVANLPDLLMRLACEGAGIVAVGDFMAEDALRRGALVRVLPDWQLPRTSAWAVFPGRRLMPAKTRVFIDALAARLRTCDDAGKFDPPKAA